MFANNEINDFIERFGLKNPMMQRMINIIERYTSVEMAMDVYNAMEQLEEAANQENTPDKDELIRVSGPFHTLGFDLKKVLFHHATDEDFRYFIDFKDSMGEVFTQMQRIAHSAGDEMEFAPPKLPPSGFVQESHSDGSKMIAVSLDALFAKEDTRIDIVERPRSYILRPGIILEARDILNNINHEKISFYHGEEFLEALKAVGHQRVVPYSTLDKLYYIQDLKNPKWDEIHENNKSSATCFMLDGFVSKLRESQLGVSVWMDAITNESPIFNASTSEEASWADEIYSLKAYAKDIARDPKIIEAKPDLPRDMEFLFRQFDYTSDDFGKSADPKIVRGAAKKIADSLRDMVDQPDGQKLKYALRDFESVYHAAQSCIEGQARHK